MKNEKADKQRFFDTLEKAIKNRPVLGGKANKKKTKKRRKLTKSKK